MWESCLQSITIPEEDHTLEAWCAGVDVPLQAARIRAVVAQVGEGGRAAVPLYIMNYIWDGDELDESELSITGGRQAFRSSACVHGCSQCGWVVCVRGGGSRSAWAAWSFSSLCLSALL